MSLQMEITDTIFEAVGRCIYCGEPPDSDEHIFPRGLGGKHILRDAEGLS